MVEAKNLDLTIHNTTIKMMGAQAKYNDLTAATTQKDLANAGEIITNNRNLMNVYLETLANQIGRNVIEKSSVDQPLGKFKQANMPYGASIQTIYVGLVEEQPFKFKGDEDKPFKFEDSNVYSHISPINRKAKYPTTIPLTEMQSAFTEQGGITQLLQTLISRLFDSASRDEYLYMDKAMENAYQTGNIRAIEVGEPNGNEDEFGKKLIKAVKENLPKSNFVVTDNIQHLARGYNGKKKYLHLTTEADAALSVGINATSYNLSELGYDAEKNILPQVQDDNIVGFLVSEDFLIVADSFNPMVITGPVNPDTMTQRMVLQVKQVIDVNPYAYAIALVKDVSKVKAGIYVPQPYRVTSNGSEVRALVGVSNPILAKVGDVDAKLTATVENSDWVNIESTEMIVSDDGYIQGFKVKVTPNEDKFPEGNDTNIKFTLTSGDNTYETPVPLYIQRDVPDKDFGDDESFY